MQPVIILSNKQIFGLALSVLYILYNYQWAFCVWAAGSQAGILRTPGERYRHFLSDKAGDLLSLTTCYTLFHNTCVDSCIKDMITSSVRDLRKAFFTETPEVSFIDKTI